MRADVQIVLSGALTFGVPLIFALRELVVLKRDRGNGWGPEAPKDPNPQPILPPELPACLRPPFPKLPQETHEWAARELELV